MHSSIISKIRILKPRKKCSVASKSFILSNENLHSTLRPNTIEVDDSSKLPNLIKNTDKNDFVDIVQLHQDSSPKLTNDWLPVYIVNVSDSTTPNLGGVVVTKEMAKVSIGGHGEAKTKSSVNIGNRYHISTRSQKRYFKKKTVRFPQSNKSETSKQETQVPSTEKTISCFLCPAKFKSVAAMQAHYLDKHKQKKRLDSQSSNCKLNVSPKKGLKPLKPKIFTEDEAKCPICSICFKTENEVNDHMTSVHCYKCSECQNTFYTLYQFTDHKCNTVNKVKRPKLKKKKSKPKLNSEKDPLIASPLLKVAVSKNDRNYVNNGHYPVANNMNEFKEPPVLYENTSSLPRYANAKCNSETTISTLAYDRPISSSKTQDSGVENRTSKEWMNFSFETLTSEEFNKEKLKELLSNPYLSVSPIKRSEHCSKVEFYSCGRCNVLCEDAADYVDHIEECLRLSNVSLICMDGPPNKMLKLNSKVVPKSGCDFSSFSINHKLIKALGNYLDSEIILGKETETNPSTVPVCDKKDINNGSFFHPDIKGNICVRKLESPSKKEVVSSCNGSSHLKTKNIKKKQPMVMIPVDKYLGVARTRKGTQAVGNIASTNSKHDDYPEISIIDKSNCITYNFHGSETSSLLKSDENRSHGGVLSEQESYQLALAKIRKSLLKQALQLKSNLSTSPSQPSDFVFPEVKDEKVSSFDLLLNEEEIKMEVEDEVVDDCFKDSDLNDDERHHSDSSLSNYEEDGSEDHWMKTTSGLYESQDTLNDELSMVCKTDEEPKVEVEKRHECPMCQECFKTNSALNGHLVKRHKTTLGERFTCHVCGALASSRGAMRRHLLRTHKITNIDHPKLLTRKCSLCRSSFSSHHLLYEHMKTAHEDELAGYSHCLWCPVIVKVKASLIRHVRRNHPDKAEAMSPVVACEVCNADLPNIPKLQQHIKKNHPNYRRHKCDQCGAVYRYPYMLSRHKLVHENPVKYEDEIKKRQKYYIQCNNCEKKFGSKRRLLTHLRNNHTPEIKEERVYTCRVCAMSFSTAKQNKRHYRILHMRERLKVHCGKCNITFTTPEECDEHRATVHPSSCDICHKQFLKRDSLREHLLIHSAPRHPCPHCDKKFTQRSNLKRHIRLHTGEKPYKCIYCSRSFSDKSAFNSHLRIHTGYTRSVCDVCGSSFANKQKLKYHLKIHSGEGLYHCPICTRPYTTSYAFRKHVPSHQMPLTKALEALGFTSLLQADPHFVENALLAVIQYTLASISKRIGKLGSTDELNSDVSSFNSSLNFGPLSSPPSLSCPNRLLEVKVESQVGSGPSNKAELDGGCCPETSSSSAKFDLTKFFQNILERQTKEIRKKRLRKRKVLPNYNEATNSDDQEGLVTEPAIDSLPETVGDELVKRCLEIVVKSEPKSESDEEFESKSFQKGGELRVTTFPLVEVMTERAETPPPNLEDSKLVPVEEIPKLKISKISQDDKDEGSGVTFISKII